ncbi:T9SS type A sorting domain-containing protein, partial [Cryomorpha ignava]
FPNPTSGPSQVVFVTAETGRTLVEVYDMSGRNITTLFNQEAQRGHEYRLDFNGAALPNGVYIYRMTTQNETIIEKFMIAK